MSSSDFTFISLRNITAYQPTGSWVPQNYVLNMSTNGAAAWTNNITLQTIRGSSITASTITGTTMIGSTIFGSNMGANYMVGSTIVGSTIIGTSIAATSSLIVGPNLLSTSTDYNYAGDPSMTSSMLIAIGDNLWKIPIEYVSAL
jgi:hypothetical protein